MEFKYYKVTEGRFVDRVMAIKSERDRILPAIINVVDCEDVLEYDRGGIAGFTFKDEETPCMETFKDAKLGHGYQAYLPRLGNKKGKNLTKLIEGFGKLEKPQDALDVYNLPTMVLGEATNKGVKMYNSSFCGDYQTKTFFIVVPQEKENPYKPEDDAMVEVKKWEMEKFMDEIND